MTTGIMFLGVIAIVVMAVALLDWWGQRKDRERHQRAAR
jgi:hypothetical protein